MNRIKENVTQMTNTILPSGYPSTRDKLLRKKCEACVSIDDFLMRNSAYADIRTQIMARKHEQLAAKKRAAAQLLEEKERADKAAAARIEAERAAASSKTAAATSSASTATAAASSTPTTAAAKSTAGRAAKSTESVKSFYTFSGMAGIFNWAEGSRARRVRFSSADAGLFCIGGGDGIIRIGRAPSSLAASEQPVQLLRGHQGELTDLQWSADDEMIASTAVDGSFRLWQVKTGKCLRHWTPGKGGLNALQIHPFNANSVVVGGDAGTVHLLNMSTGKATESDVISTRPITALVFDAAGSLLFAGDQGGTLHICSYAHLQQEDATDDPSAAPAPSPRTPSARAASAPSSVAKPSSSSSSSSSSSKKKAKEFDWADFFDPLQAFHKPAPVMRIKSLAQFRISGESISSLSYQPPSAQSADPNCGLLAVVSRDNRLSLLSVDLLEPTHIKQLTSIHLDSATVPSLRTSFCAASPALVAGAEDCGIYFFKTQPTGAAYDNKPFNSLMGHGAPVLDVSWNRDQSLLASSDASGVVILWKRTQQQT